MDGKRYKLSSVRVSYDRTIRCGKPRLNRSRKFLVGKSPMGRVWILIFLLSIVGIPSTVHAICWKCWFSGEFPGVSLCTIASGAGLEQCENIWIDTFNKICVLGGLGCTGNGGGGGFDPSGVPGDFTDEGGIDFNRDGFLDIAIGRGRMNGTGDVEVLFGSPDGWTTPAVYLSEPAQKDDLYGAAVSAGDFDGDGHTDIAIGAPGFGRDSGAVYIRRGDQSGLENRWKRITEGMIRAGGERDAVEEPGDQFGWSLASADFNCDGFDDIAVGIPGNRVATVRSAGSVQVLFGSEKGLSPYGRRILHQGKNRINGIPEEDDRFGSVLAAGNLDGNGCDDLAIAVPGETVDKRKDAGAVQIFYGGIRGIGDHRNRYLTGKGLWGVKEYDQLAVALRIIDVDDSGIGDLLMQFNAGSGSLVTVFDPVRKKRHLRWRIQKSQAPWPDILGPRDCITDADGVPICICDPSKEDCTRYATACKTVAGVHAIESSGSETCSFPHIRFGDSRRSCSIREPGNAGRQRPYERAGDRN